ncbi:NAD(P)/FAD-dependent oxidoreductase [Thermaerobacter sp. FW80]|uniref:NAD(P)/FAD-dependent oxidoreductase n=1 Tax=Thermaerobacter sp. FW80 TaxID=2546351 RepID=UPI001074FC8F|nr:NAD(P)/FAD-dependent oxidoreductase [Thermaerobacter sp. FW80]QBS37577.1 NAD(P)/FAD-dependent oxidoreductase [Thermaerobacter sp. FW80]
MNLYDVVVVGAGLAGLQCARLLAGQGVKVLLVDRKPQVDRFVHTTGIFVRKTLESFDLPADCLGPVVRDVVLYSPAGRALHLSSLHDEFRVGRLRRLYGRWLDEAVGAGAHWAGGTRFLGSEPGRSGGVCRVDLETGGRRWAVQARFLIGADGCQSAVARDLGLDVNREWIVGAEEVYRGVPLDGPPAFHCYLDPRLAPGYLAWVVHDGEEVHVGTGGYPDRFHVTTALAAFKERVAPRLGLQRGRLVERRGGRIPVGGVLRRIACPRGLLVGDAAGAVSPLTAGGLDPCLRLSDLASHVVAAYLDRGDPRILELYHGGAFQPRFLSRRWMRRALAAFRHPLWYELACAAFRGTPLRRLAWQVFFGRGSFPDVEPLKAALGVGV